MNRRDLFRTALVGALGAAAGPAANAREFPPGFDASKELERADWKPLFLDDHQNQTLIAISECIIPATDTPGAKAALVNRFLDLLMSSETAETQRSFVAALSYIDGASMERHRTAFIYLSPEQQNELLSLIAWPHTFERWREQEENEYPGYLHFQKLKDWISGAYYSSEIGIKELGWDGSFPHGAFSGCEHGESSHGQQAPVE